MSKQHRPNTPRRLSRQHHRRGILLFLVEITLALLLISGTVFAAYRYIIDSNYLKVRTLRIEGMRSVSAETIREAAGITEADNLLLLDLAGVRARIEAVPYIQHCEVHPAFPNAVVIQIEEREPSATLLVNRHLYELDQSGVVLRELDARSGKTGPFITNVPKLAYVRVGERVDDPALQSALAVWRAFSAVSVAREVTVSEIAAFSQNNILMYCDDLGFEIRWGRTDFEGQARRLDVFWRAKSNQLACNEYIDLRFDGKVVCR